MSYCDKSKLSSIWALIPPQTMGYKCQMLSQIYRAGTSNLCQAWPTGLWTMVNHQRIVYVPNYSWIFHQHMALPRGPKVWVTVSCTFLSLLQGVKHRRLQQVALQSIQLHSTFSKPSTNPGPRSFLSIPPLVRMFHARPSLQAPLQMCSFLCLHQSTPAFSVHSMSMKECV